MPKYLDPVRYAAFVRWRTALAKYDLAAVQADERAKFASAGLDPLAGRKRLDEVLFSLSGQRFDHVNGTDSVPLATVCLSQLPSSASSGGGKPLHQAQEPGLDSR